MELTVATPCWWRPVSIQYCDIVKAVEYLLFLGVFSADGGQPTTIEHSPRDFLPVENTYQEPAFTTAHVLEAVQTIFRREQWMVE